MDVASIAAQVYLLYLLYLKLIFLNPFTSYLLWALLISLTENKLLHLL